MSLSPAFTLLIKTNCLTLFCDALYLILLHVGIKDALKVDFASSLGNIGYAYYLKGKQDKALEFYIRSQEIYEEIGDQSGMASILNNIGLTYDELGNVQKSILCYNRSLKIQEEIGDKNGITNSLNNIGALYLQEGSTTEALKLSLKSLAISQEIGFPDRIQIAAAILYHRYTDIYSRKISR